jgi:hypothetical protein
MIAKTSFSPSQAKELIPVPVATAAEKEAVSVPRWDTRCKTLGTCRTERQGNEQEIRAKAHVNIHAYLGFN